MISERKVHPITENHQSMSSLAAECMTDANAKRGFLIYFNEDGVMNAGHFGVTLNDTCMAAAYLNMMATREME